MATTLKVMSYNTHLFGDVVGWISNVGWKDSDRVKTLKSCIENADICGADIIAIEEIWSKDLVHEFTQDKAFCELYPYNFHDLHSPGHAIPSNPSGLLLLTNSRVQLDTEKAEYYDYIHEIGYSKFDKKQDVPTGKGFYKVPAMVDGNVAITLFITHMPTNSHAYPEGVGQCFQNLAAAVPTDGSPVLLLGDFNITEGAKPLPDGQDRYTIWVGPNGFLGAAGLSDAFRNIYPDVQTNPGYSVIGATNTCWRHFNTKKVEKNEYDTLRIDYMMYRGMIPLTLEVMGKVPPQPPAVSDYSDDGNSWIWLDDGINTRDLSDHYPIIGTFSL